MDEDLGAQVARLRKELSALQRNSEMPPLSTIVLPVGAHVAGEWSTGAVPTGYVLANGAVLNIADYPKLANHYAAVYGASNHHGGDGTTTFAVPDTRERTYVNQGGADIFATIGAKLGAKTHTLTSAEMPAHTHTQTAHTHANTLASATVASSTHAHPLSDAGAAAIDVNSGYVTERRVGAPAWASTIRAAGTTSLRAASFTSGAALVGSTDPAGATATVTISNASATATNQTTGGGAAHNNVQPSFVCRYVIRAI